ncbi:HutD family protein [Liquorilactobacillus cacaonum]|nr:HutD family protein [Liquorilactobacillus cacaonum]
MIEMFLKKAATYKTIKWSGGETTELYIYPETSSYKERNFEFRLSFATVDVEKSTFTSLPKFKRIIMPLSDEIELSKNGEITQVRPKQVFNFDGADPIKSKGISTDVNLMFERGLVGNMGMLDETQNKIKTDANFICFYNLDEKAEVSFGEQKVTLFSRDCVIIKNTNKELLEINIDLFGDIYGIVLFEVKKGD